MSEPQQSPVRRGPRDLTPEEQRARRGRNIALAVSLIVFVVLIFLVTVFHLQGNVTDRAL